MKKETLTELNLPFLTLLLFGLVLKCVQNKGKKVIINIYKYYIIKKLFNACYRMISMFFLKNEITALFSVNTCITSNAYNFTADQHNINICMWAAFCLCFRWQHTGISKNK